MLFQEQSTNQSEDKKLIKVELTLTFEKDMTPNILTPQLCEMLAELGAIGAVGSVKNVIEYENEVNAVAIVNN